MLIIRTRQSGFSILELLIALSISAILIGLAVPAMMSFIGGAEIVATSNQFVHSLQTARSEAIKRSGFVGLCPSSNSLSNTASCGGTNYGAGWIVFVDDDGDGTRDSGDELIIQVEERSASFVFTADSVFSDRVYFGSFGTSISPAGIPLSGSVSIVHSENETRDVNIAANGFISVNDPGVSGGS